VGRVYAWALGAFGPGWEPVGRHYLVDKVEEEAARKEDRPAVAAMTAHCVKNGFARRRYFTVDDGEVTEYLGYHEAFGPALTDLHPTLRFMHRGKELPADHFTLGWGEIDRYEPMTAEQFASLRASRERAKAEREEKGWREQAPLFSTWAERNAEPEGRER
jgi:hypothetical protein